MITHLSRSTSKCPVIAIDSTERPQPSPVSALIRDLLHRAGPMNLADLARLIRTDRNFCTSVARAASAESGSLCRRIEDAIVLLGRNRLSALLSACIGRCVAKHHGLHDSNRAAAIPCRPARFSGEHK